MTDTAHGKINVVEKLFELPNVIGMSQDEAMKALTDKGFVVNPMTEDTEKENEDKKVIRSVPAAASKAGKGSKVDIVVGKRKPIAVKFKKQRVTLGDKTANFDDIDSAEGLVYLSNEPVKITLESSVSTNFGKIRGAAYTTNGRNATFAEATGPDREKDIKGELIGAPGQTLDFVFSAEVQDLDASGKPIASAVQSYPDTQHGKIVIRKFQPFRAAFTGKTAKIKNDLKKFEDIPSSGWIYTTTDAGGTVEYAVSWRIDGGYLKAVQCSINGGTNWMTREIRSDEQPDSHVFKAPFKTAAAPGNVHNVVCVFQGVDVDERGEEVSEQKLVRDDPAVKVMFVKMSTPDVGLMDIRIDGVPLGEIPPTLPIEEIQNGEIHITGSLKSNLPVDHLKVSFDGGAAWETVKADPQWAYVFKPEADRDYEVQLRVILKDGREVEPKDYPKARFRFVKSPVKPEIELTDIKLDGEPLEDIPPLIRMEDIPNGEIHITGRFQSNVPVDHLMISFDGGAKWEELEAKPEWSYDFKPVPDEDYEMVFKAVLQEGDVADVSGYPKTRFRFTGAEAAAEDPEKVLQEMVSAYENKDYSGFMSRISEDFPDRGELEEFIRRDFRDFDGVKVNLFFKNTVDIPEGKSIQVDWEIRYAPAAVATQVVARGQSLDFVFASEDGRLKLVKMRGANPLFGARSPDVAESSGVPSAVAETLQKIEDEGSRESKATALNVVASDLLTSTQVIPLTFEIVSVSARYMDGAMEEVDFDALQTGRPISGEATIRITDNPKNIDVTGIELEITDNISGEVVTFTGDVQANQEVVFRVTDPIIFDPGDAGKSGRLTFVLDPADKFIAIDREAKTVRQDYTLV